MANLIGQQLGNYRLTSLLGDGGFAEVYLGEHIHIGTQAAIKVSHTQLTSIDVANFRNEASTIARLIHPHIVRVLEFGIERGTPFLVMDYAPNGTLRDHHPKGTRLPLHVVVSYTRQMADALQFAHDAKLIHRDIKPENMLVGQRNEVLLSDFGIAVVAHSTRSQKTQDVIGTVDYMAPEQIRAHPTIASDQYALGCVVYEWLAGAPPFQGTATEVVVKHLQVSPPPLSARIPGIPSAVEKVVLRVLEKDPQKRFAKVQEFATALEQVYASLKAPTVGVQSPAPALLPANIALPPPPRSTQRPGTLISKYEGHNEQVSDVAWSPDGKRLAFSAGKGVQVWDDASGNKIAFISHSAYVRSIAWSPDGRWIASAGDDKTIQIWDAATGKHEFTYAGHFNQVHTVAWSPDGALVASTANDGTVQVWDFTGYAIFTYRSQPQQQQQQVGGWGSQSSAWGSQPAWGASPQAQQDPWAQASAQPGGLRGKSAYPSLPAPSAAWSPDRKRIAFASHGPVQVWDIATGRIVVTYAGPSVDAYTDNIDWSPDCKYIASICRGSASQNAWGDPWTGVIQVWDASNGRTLFTCGNAYSMAWSPDGTHLATIGTDKTVQVWDAINGKLIFTYTGHFDFVNSVAWSLNGARIASCSRDGTVQIWNATTGGYVFTYRQHSGAVQKVLWSPDGSRIASVGIDRTIQVWVAG